VSSHHEGDDSIAVGTDCLDGEEKVGTVLTLKVIDGNGYAWSAGERSGQSIIIALNIDPIGEGDLSSFRNSDAV